MGKKDLKFLRVAIPIAVVIIIACICTVILCNSQNQACVEKGYTRFKSTNEFDYCVASNGDLHLVEWYYTGFLKIDVREINVFGL